MKNLRRSWKLIALFAVAAIVSLCYVVRSRAFTLIEMQYLPAVQLVALQSAAVKVSNITDGTVVISVEIIGDNGTLLVRMQDSLAAGHTFTLPYKAPAGAPTGIRALIGLSAANATVSSIMTFDKTTGEVIAILPFIKFTGNGQ